MSLRERLSSLFYRRIHSLPSTPRPELKENVRLFLAELPKSEIHFHFEGALSVDVICQLGFKYQVKHIRTRSDAEWCLFFSNARQFFEQFLTVSSLLREEEDFYIAALDLGRRLNAENIRYIEITLAPHKFVRAGVPYPVLINAIDRGLLDS